ncbi:MAG: YggS family pyridoxal phosphate-dependent enzyme [Chloroflexota bacterium]
MTIKQNVRKITEELPEGVRLVAAAKTREPREILEAIEAGVGIIGENYVQEAEKSREAVGGRAAWHFIGHLQRNKVKKAVEIFDMIETVDSVEIAREIDKRCAPAGRTMPVLVEINSGREPQKSGVAPEDAEPLIREIAALPHIRVMGLMTMGPLTGHPEESRPCFAETKRVFDRIKGLQLPNVAMQYLSMGMTHSYRVALEEGANLVRIGTGIFGERPRK